MREVYERVAALAKQNQGYVGCLRDAPQPAAPAASGTVSVGPAQLRARLLASAGDVGADRQRGTAWHSTACHLTLPLRAHLRAMLRPEGFGGHGAACPTGRLLGVCQHWGAGGSGKLG